MNEYQIEYQILNILEVVNCVSETQPRVSENYNE